VLQSLYSHMTASSSASWSRFSPSQILLMGTYQQCLTVGTVVDSGSCLSLSTITRWLRETPFVQVSTTWALPCPETVHQRPCMTREIETWLSDSRVGNNSVWLTTEADDGLRWFEAHCQLPLYNAEEVQHCWALAAMRGLQAAWNQMHWTMKLGVDEICVAGYSPHLIAVFSNWVA